MSVVTGAMFCSGCGLCETYSCPQGLSPRMVISEMKSVARQNGLKLPTDVPFNPNPKDAELKKVSVERLSARLGLSKYDKPAPISEDFSTKQVKIMLAQSIGTPAVACVNIGDTVKAGDTIGKIKDGALGVNVHASIDGKITAVNEKYIKISKV